MERAFCEAYSASLQKENCMKKLLIAFGIVLLGVLATAGAKAAADRL